MKCSDAMEWIGWSIVNVRVQGSKQRATMRGEVSCLCACSVCMREEASVAVGC